MQVVIDDEDVLASPGRALAAPFAGGLAVLGFSLYVVDRGWVVSILVSLLWFAVLCINLIFVPWRRARRAAADSRIQSRT